MDRTDKHPVREGALKRLSCWLPLLSSQLISHFRDRSWQPIIAIGDRVVNQFPPGQVDGIRDKGIPARLLLKRELAGFHATGVVGARRFLLGIACHRIEETGRYRFHMLILRWTQAVLILEKGAFRVRLNIDFCRIWRSMQDGITVGIGIDNRTPNIRK